MSFLFFFFTKQCFYPFSLFLSLSLSLSFAPQGASDATTTTVSNETTAYETEPPLSSLSATKDCTRDTLPPPSPPSPSSGLESGVGGPFASGPAIAALTAHPARLPRARVRVDLHRHQRPQIRPRFAASPSAFSRRSTSALGRGPRRWRATASRGSFRTPGCRRRRGPPRRRSRRRGRATPETPGSRRQRKRCRCCCCSTRHPSPFSRRSCCCRSRG